MRVMFVLTHGTPAFTEHRHSKSRHLCRLILMNTNIDSDFIGDIAGSLRDWRSGWTQTQIGLTAYMPVVVPLS